jgi:UPF0716 protein FxsA
MILFAIFASLIGMTLLEFYVVIKVGEAIGVLPTLGLMVLDAIVGSALMRSQGRAVWRRLRAALAAGRPPAREVLDGALVVAGGAFLITPGFVTDVFGALLLLPPTRAIVRRWIVRHFTGRVLGSTAGGWARRRERGSAAGGVGWDEARPGPSAGAQPPPAGTPYDVEGEAVEIDGGELER